MENLTRLIHLLRGYLEFAETLNTVADSGFIYHFDVEIFEDFPEDFELYNAVSIQQAQTILYQWFRAGFPDEIYFCPIWQNAENFFDIIEIEVFKRPPFVCSLLHCESSSALFFHNDWLKIGVYLEKDKK
ncbi:MAG TPA: hypothetical protein DEG17_05960 [Cyanobacteria bacterium UBA11149]|nr:hypothetical protein [Cyanobacteria bacterium UBA11367]HBE58118.1 hypothetical protein [Cyanobacteria bacterium UBA11366]HBK62585.1 hypothetical protein [Cyanobacteria bacterium UBA11166]HBR72343.1 hypothetical protein [Cyanobacteria bacterium UBA11159]HBS71112.1 hypothetical protein [Cyanobacteria bacterium UBA11153]HBW88421.1 hypothetical protein [Cyanobacteria bacterium UBA11149]HCA93357.1 hypothetical protein [Cyanobacteria bacterium UBA9226]